MVFLQTAPPRAVKLAETSTSPPQHATPTRIDVPHVAQHVVQRGNDREPCFFTSSDYERYRSDLREITLHEVCEIHAYVRTTNHVHLLMTHFQLAAAKKNFMHLSFAFYDVERIEVEIETLAHAISSSQR